MHPALQSLKRAPYFDTYLRLLETDDLMLELNRSQQAMHEVLAGLTEEQWNHRYASDRWNIKEVVYHIIETELVFNYRAIRIGREEVSQNLEGFDQDLYLKQTDLSGLAGEELLSLFDATRTSTKLLVKTFSDLQMEKTGFASGNMTQVKAVFYITAGHTIHHLNVLKERYLD